MPPSNPVTTDKVSDAVEAPITSVGPGAIPKAHEQQPSLLEGAAEYEWVDLFNPLSVTFVAQVASSRPVNASVKVYQTPGLQSGIRNESDLATQYGLTGFKNPDHPSVVHVPHTIEIVSGATRRFPGNEAQVVLKQLVGYILQVEGKSLKLADPFERYQMEQRLIRGRGNVQDLMDSAPISVQAQMNAAIDRSNTNQEKTHVAAQPEVEFPDAQLHDSDRGSRDIAGPPTGGDASSPKVQRPTP